MKRVYLDYIYRGENNEEKYILAKKLGRQLVDYLGEELFTLLVDSKVLMSKRLINIFSDASYTLHPAAKSFEGFLKKLIKQQKLCESKDDEIGNVFGNKQGRLRKKIKELKIISKTKTVWDYSRNDTMHYKSKNKISFIEVGDRFDDIIEVIQVLFKDFYGKSLPDEEINKKYDIYIAKKYRGRKFVWKQKIIRFINKM